jgi:hypothetical protein
MCLGPVGRTDIVEEGVRSLVDGLLRAGQVKGAQR